jgi:hypothetical protein
MARLGLAETIAQLREELAEAIEAAGNEELRFEVGEITVELSVEIERRAGAGAKVRFWVVEIGADGAVASRSTHKVVLPLTPRHRDSRGPVLTGGDEVPD